MPLLMLARKGGRARPCRFCRRQREKEVRAPVRNARKESSPKPEQIHRTDTLVSGSCYSEYQSYCSIPVFPWYDWFCSTNIFLVITPLIICSVLPLHLLQPLLIFPPKVAVAAIRVVVDAVILALEHGGLLHFRFCVVNATSSCMTGRR
ncbi:uncharacterized protein LOC130969906 isoform X2 [Arachis stenosperma]|uniref:uncharacterized protein LOC130969906 isoform X2 n=1 Tax=Arachis stenosperma TaxID=217475 RepID=UPI0025AD40E6|nr:uncharacterized protein LOC130969906 isoform X2 [Arachis stenosperma]